MGIGEMVKLVDAEKKLKKHGVTARELASFLLMLAKMSPSSRRILIAKDNEMAKAEKRNDRTLLTMYLAFKVLVAEGGLSGTD